MARQFLSGIDLLGQLATAINANLSSGKLLGRSTAGAGAIEEITIGSGLSLSGGTLSATGGGAGGGGGLTHFVESEETASPNATVPVDALTATDASYTDIDVALVAKGTGATLAQVPDGTTTGGNKRGTYATDLQKARAGASQVASANASVICGGQNNAASAQWSFIGGGLGNTVSNTTATVSGGSSNTASGSSAAIAGGGANQATSNYSFIGGGQSNEAKTNTHATCAGGYLNDATGRYSFVGGGYNNTASGTYATVAGGQSNTASDSQSTVAGGLLNTASASGATVGGGRSNTASTYATVAGGYSNTASGDFATVGGGQNNAASGSYSFIAGGRYGTTRSIIGYHVFPACDSPITGSTGVTQSALLLLARETTTATATVLTSNGSAAGTTNQVVLPNNAAYSFSGEVIAGVTGGGDTARWTINGAIKRGANAASTTMVGTATVTMTHNDAGAAAWTVAVTADTTNGGIAVTVTGAAATTIRWVCKINTTEMSY